MHSLRLTATIACAALTFTSVHAQQDAPPADLTQLLTVLKAMKEQQQQVARAQKLKGMQDVQSAAASPSAAAAAWEEAVRQVQFEGVAREGAAFREWKDKEGAGLDDKDGQNAARLYFQWLALTIQRSAGAQVKDMMPQIVAYTKEVTASQLAMESLEERMKKEREMAASGKHGKERKGNDDQVKRTYDQIMKGALPGSIPVRALKLENAIEAESFGGAVAPEGRRAQPNAQGWEMVPGSVDGIFQKIILPELRAQRDPRLLEYWDMKIKRDGDMAAKSKLAFDAEKFAQQRRPELLFGRAEDEILLGRRNKGINDMFALLKTYPTHPNADGWISKVESLLTAPAAAATTPPAASTPPAR